MKAAKLSPRQPCGRSLGHVRVAFFELVCSETGFKYTTPRCVLCRGPVSLAAESRRRAVSERLFHVVLYFHDAAGGPRPSLVP